MAVNINKGYSAGKILKTPAPDLVTNIRSPGGGGSGYGMNGVQPSSVPAGRAVMSALGQNLMESQDDGEGVLQKIINGGVAGRDDRVPADGSDQTRGVSAQSLPITRGMKAGE